MEYDDPSGAKPRWGCWDEKMKKKRWGGAVLGGGGGGACMNRPSEHPLFEKKIFWGGPHGLGSREKKETFKRGRTKKKSAYSSAWKGREGNQGRRKGQKSRDEATFEGKMRARTTKSCPNKKGQVRERRGRNRKRGVL